MTYPYNIATLKSQFDKDLSYFLDRASAKTTYPPYSVKKESDSTYVVQVAVAGLKEDDIEVSLVDGQLDIVATPQKDDSAYVYKGIATRPFKLSFKLHEYFNVSDAKLENGLLEVKLDFIVPEEKKPKKIAINGTIKSSKELLSE